MTAYRVTAPMITCRSPSAALTPPPWYTGPAIDPVTEFYRDAVLPDDVPAEEIDRLFDAGLITVEPD